MAKAAATTAKEKDPGEEVHTTTLDNDITKPSVTAPGDGPADTTDPTEHATSVTPNPGEEAMRAGTVNAVKILPAAVSIQADEPVEQQEDRIEEYKQVRPDGAIVTIRRNIETGDSEIINVDKSHLDDTDDDE